MDCVFCKIVADEVPSVRVYEDDATLAFMDVNPLTEGHLLVVPKVHVRNLFEADAETLRRTIDSVQRVAYAARQALDTDSFNVLQANGPHAYQSVEHMHFHLIPRREHDGAGLDWALVPGSEEEIRRVGDRIRFSIA